MRILKHLKDPVYIVRPRQIFRRMRYFFSSPSGATEAPLPWGHKLKVRAGETNGRTILERGLDQLTVVESCMRLMEPGGTAVDIGANYGQMTSALAYRARPNGKVFSFEPHPDLFKYLEQNLRELSGTTPVHKAVSTEKGTSTLHVPETWRQDAGVSSLEPDFREDTKEVEVEMTSLDEEFEGQNILVLKVDVEGHGKKVFGGGEKILSRGRVKHILFEEHNYRESGAVEILKQNGYNIYTVEKMLKGPRLGNARPDGKDFIATLDEEHCRRRFKEKGWRALGQ